MDALGRKRHVSTTVWNVAVSSASVLVEPNRCERLMCVSTVHVCAVSSSDLDMVTCMMCDARVSRWTRFEVSVHCYIVGSVDSLYDMRVSLCACARHRGDCARYVLSASPSIV